MCTGKKQTIVNTVRLISYTQRSLCDLRKNSQCNNVYDCVKAFAENVNVDINGTNTVTSARSKRVREVSKKMESYIVTSIVGIGTRKWFVHSEAFRASSGKYIYLLGIYKINIEIAEHLNNNTELLTNLACFEPTNSSFPDPECGELLANNYKQYFSIIDIENVCSQIISAKQYITNDDSVSTYDLYDKLAILPITFDQMLELNKLYWL